MQEALKRQKEGRATEEDLKLLESRYKAEALTFFVLESLRAINPKNIVIEEVVEYADTSASHMLRRVLKSMGYKLSETIYTLEENIGCAYDNEDEEIIKELNRISQETNDLFRRCRFFKCTHPSKIKKDNGFYYCTDSIYT